MYRRHGYAPGIFEEFRRRNRVTIYIGLRKVYSRNKAFLTFLFDQRLRATDFTFLELTHRDNEEKRPSNYWEIKKTFHVDTVCSM